MATARPMLATETLTPPVRSGPHKAVDTISALEERLSDVERELFLQFTRIAELQAELDVFSGALRRLCADVDRATRRR